MKDNPKEENKTNTTDELRNAVRIVRAAIKAKEEEYLKIATTYDQDPVLLEGETATGHECQLMVNPRDVAGVFLDYNHPICLVLEEDSPNPMWDYLARFYGIKTVRSVNL